MTHTELIQRLMDSLVITDEMTVGEIMATKVGWTAGHSARVQAAKHLKKLEGEGYVERCKGFWRLAGASKSDYKEHAQILTKALAEILKLPFQTTVQREVTIPQIGLRPDAICLITKDNQALCLILEAVHEETAEYLAMKVNAWHNWPEATQYLSNLFKIRIPHFDLTVAGDLTVDGAFEFNWYVKEVILCGK